MTDSKTNGYFITFEGGEGSGKTTQAERLKSYIEHELGHEVVLTREPGGIELAEEIRYLLLKPERKDMEVITEALLYAAARREHYNEIIKPALEEGKVVLSDRFIDSSLVYQGVVKDGGFDNILSINKIATDSRMPDLTLFFDIEPQTGLFRIGKNASREKNRFDNQALLFHEQVQSAYKWLAEMYSGRIATVNGNGLVEEVYDEATKIIHAYLGEKGREMKRYIASFHVTIYDAQRRSEAISSPVMFLDGFTQQEAIDKGTKKIEEMYSDTPGIELTEVAIDTLKVLHN